MLADTHGQIQLVPGKDTIFIFYDIH